MVVFRSVVSFAENLLNRAKWSLHLHSVIPRSSAALFSTEVNEIPVPPKRPPTAYMIFCKQNRPHVLKENPDSRGTELIKILAERWAELTPPLKKPYEEIARENTIIYGKQHKEFYENLTEEQRDALHQFKVEKRESRKVQKLKKALKGSGMPKLPSNAYTIFVRTKAKQVGDIKSGPNFIKQAAEEWHILSEEEKEVFYEKAREEKLRFENEVAEWREKLTAEGLTDLLKSYEEGKYRQRTTASSSSVVAKKKVSAVKESVSKEMANPKN